MALVEKIEELANASADQTLASQALAQEVAGKMDQIDQKVNAAIEEIQAGKVESLKIGTERISAHTIDAHTSFHHLHLKTDIMQTSSAMVGFNLKGYFYPHGVVDTDVSFYVYQHENYAQIGKLYHFRVNHKGVGTRIVDGNEEHLFDVKYYFDEDEHLVIVVFGLNRNSRLNLNNFIPAGNGIEFKILERVFSDSFEPAFGG